MAELRPPYSDVTPTIRALFCITSNPAATLQQPDAWSAELAAFLGACLHKDAKQRHSAASLHEHPPSDPAVEHAQVMRWAMSLVDDDRTCRPIWQYLMDAAYFAIDCASQCPAFARLPASERLVAEPRNSDVWADSVTAAEVWGADDADEACEADDADDAGM